MKFFEILIINTTFAFLIVLFFEIFGEGEKGGWIGMALGWTLDKLKSLHPGPVSQIKTVAKTPRYRIAILYQIVETIKLGTLNPPDWRIEEWIIETSSICAAADRARVLLLDEHQWWKQKIAIKAIVEDKDGWILANIADKIGWKGHLFVLQHQDWKGAF